MFYKLVRPLLYAFMKLFYPHKVYGKENLPKGGHIVVCNHFGKIDIFYVGALYKGKTYFLAKKELFQKKFYAKVVRALGGIPVQRDGVDLDCIRESLKVLKAGERLAIFPEGKRNFKDSELQELKAGAGMFAFKAKVPIVPVMMEKKAKAFKRTNMLVGKPIYLDEYFGQPLNAELNDKLNDLVREGMLNTQAKLRSMLAEENK